MVGGVCAVLHGAPVTTIDLDLVYSRDRSNLERLAEALADLEQPAAALNATVLDGPGHHLLMTRWGPLDLLGSAGDNEGYEELIGHTQTIDLEGGIKVRVLDLPTLIRLKEALAGERDLAVLPILRRLLVLKRGD